MAGSKGLPALILALTVGQPAFAQSAAVGTSRQALPPGWSYGVVLDAEGNRLIGPMPPDVILPAPTVADDPIRRAQNQLDILRMALEAYYTAHRVGVPEYPTAKSLDELVRMLQDEGTLPEGWHPGGGVTGFTATSSGFWIRLAVAGTEVAIGPRPRRNPYAMFWLPPHAP